MKESTSPQAWTWGAPGGVPFVMLHSLGADGDSYRWAAEQMLATSDVHVVAPDLVGHGSNLRKPDAMAISLDDFARDVIMMLDDSGLYRVHLVGSSMGGVVAWMAALAAPSRFKSVTLIASGSPAVAAPAARAGLAERGRVALEEGMEAVVDATLSRWFSADRVQADADFVRYARRTLMAMSPSAWAASWRALADCRELPAIDPRIPVLCIAGSDDVSAPPAMVEALSRSVGSARFEIVEGGDHQLAMSKPKAIAELLLRHAGVARRGAIA